MAPSTTRHGTANARQRLLRAARLGGCGPVAPRGANGHAGGCVDQIGGEGNNGRRSLVERITGSLTFI